MVMLKPIKSRPEPKIAPILAEDNVKINVDTKLLDHRAPRKIKKNIFTSRLRIQ